MNYELREPDYYREQEERSEANENALIQRGEEMREVKSLSETRFLPLDPDQQKRMLAVLRLAFDATVDTDQLEFICVITENLDYQTGVEMRGDLK